MRTCLLQLLMFRMSTLTCEQHCACAISNLVLMNTLRTTTKYRRRGEGRERLYQFGRWSKRSIPLTAYQDKVSQLTYLAQNLHVQVAFFRRRVPRSRKPRFARARGVCFDWPPDCSDIRNVAVGKDEKYRCFFLFREWCNQTLQIDESLKYSESMTTSSDSKLSYLLPLHVHMLVTKALRSHRAAFLKWPI